MAIVAAAGLCIAGACRGNGGGADPIASAGGAADPIAGAQRGATSTTETSSAASSGSGTALPSPPAWVGTASALAKLRPGDVLPASQDVHLDAAKNEIEPFQIAFAGADGRLITAATPSDLGGPGGATIAASHFIVHRQALFNVPSSSDGQSSPGLYPDPLIPDVDPIAHEKRNAFPMAVPQGELRALWVDLVVPPDTPAGEYHGQLRIDASEGPFAVPITLRVRAFALPSTPTLRTAFAAASDNACTAHYGGDAACAAAFGSLDAANEHLRTLYARVMLDHRLSAHNLVTRGPPDVTFEHFDAVYGPLLAGTAPTLLSGARLTTTRIRTKDATWVKAWRDHFAAKGFTATLFDYTCDEPPNGCSFSSIPSAAAPIRAGGVRTLVTTSLQSAQSAGVLDSIDILVPIVNHMSPVGPSSAYAKWLAKSSLETLWWYQSCESHGCGEGCGSGAKSAGYMPSYVIDALPVQARAMEWLSYLYGPSGELYWQTTHQLDTAWDNQCAFDGAGDGTMFYPGTPARIGGTSHIPVASIRLKLVREGVEDYEYLHLCDALGDAAFAKQVATALFPDKNDVRVTAEVFYAARAKLADRIEQLMK